MKKLRNGQPPVRKIAVGSAAAVTALGTDRHGHLAQRSRHRAGPQ